MHLSIERQGAILNLLRQYKDLFDGTLGDFYTEPVHLNLKTNSVVKHHNSFPVPKIYQVMLWTKLARLYKIGIIISGSMWASPTLIIPKKNGTVVRRFISDFRYVNKCLIHKPYPIPKIADVLQKLVGGRYATSLDLNTGYCKVHLDPDSQKICTILTPWGKNTRIMPTYGY